MYHFSQLQNSEKAAEFPVITKAITLFKNVYTIMFITRSPINYHPVLQVN